MPARDADPPLFLRQLDLAVFLLPLPLFILGALPILGWAVGAGAWLVQRVMQLLFNRRAEASDDPRTVAGLLVASMLARGWLVALSLFAVGLKDADAGLAAAVLCITAFTVHLTIRMLMRPVPQRGAAP